MPVALSGCNLALYLSLILPLFSQQDHSSLSLGPAKKQFLPCDSSSALSSHFMFFCCSFSWNLLSAAAAAAPRPSPAPLTLILLSCHLPGSPFRDEITLAILQLQENNRLEILKRRWWEGGQCPKEEDHRAKGQSTAAVCLPSLLLANVPPVIVSTLC